MKKPKRDSLYLPSLVIKPEDFKIDKKIPLLNGHTRTCDGCGITVGESWQFCGTCASGENIKGMNIVKQENKPKP